MTEMETFLQGWGEGDCPVCGHYYTVGFVSPEQLRNWRLTECECGNFRVVQDVADAGGGKVQ